MNQIGQAGALFHNVLLAGLDSLFVLYVTCSDTQDDLFHTLPRTEFRMCSRMLCPGVWFSRWTMPYLQGYQPWIERGSRAAFGIELC